MILSNIFGSSRFLKEPFNYESNLIGDLKMRQLLNVIEKALETCSHCQLRKKNHYCIDISCAHRELICPECDVNQIDRKHYLHDYSYIVPFLTKDIFGNFLKIKKKVSAFHDDLKTQINKIEQYLRQLYKVEGTVKKQLNILQMEEEKGKIKDYITKMNQFLTNYKPGNKLRELFQNVLFLSAQQCQRKEDQMKDQIIHSLETLKWPKDPQKVLKQKLKGNIEDEKKQIFISIFKSVEINEIDSNFRANTQFLTENLQNHQVEIKLDSDLLGKPKFYESFIFHFRNCKKIYIENGSISHLRTPLTFRNLQSLQFNFNLQAEPQNIKMDAASDRLKELTFRRFREEDTKILKYIVNPSVTLKKLHLQFCNKIDLYCFKDLLDFFRQDNLKNLISFTFKIRTEGEVKRLYGYLSKFTKDPIQSDWNINKALIHLIETNSHLTKFVVEGVRPLEMPIIVSKLKKLSFLMDYRIYFENVDLMTEVEERQFKYLETICNKRKRLLLGLAKASKTKLLHKGVVDHVVSSFLM